jgi:hypothetical protein
LAVGASLSTRRTSTAQCFALGTATDRPGVYVLCVHFGRPWALAPLLVGGLLLPASPAAARSFVIKAQGSSTGLGQVRAIGDFKPARDPRLAAAIGAWGDPSGKSGGGDFCKVRWAALGIRFTFQNFGAVDSCQPRHGRAQKGVVSGDRPWRTGKGLRLGDTVARLKRLYPRSRRSRRGFPLVRAVSPFGRITRYTVLGARISQGRVSAFTLKVFAAGD